MMNLLIILNSIGILFLLFRNQKYYFTFSKQQTFFNKTLLGYDLTLWREQGYGANSVFSLNIPIRNRKKVETKEEVERMVNYSQQNKLQTLSAKFSYLKTWKEVKDFEMTYSVVDRKIVEDLISKFKETWLNGEAY